MSPTPARLAEAHRIAAQLVVQRPAALPVFLRLERELAAHEAQGSALARAAQIAGARP